VISITLSYLIALRVVVSRFQIKGSFSRLVFLQLARIVVPFLFAFLTFFLVRETALFLDRISHDDFSRLLIGSLAVSVPWIFVYGLSMMKTISGLTDSSL
jgi:hypothetical protein